MAYHSLQVYSGPIGEDATESSFWGNGLFYPFIDNRYLFHEYLDHHKIGCLFMGDIIVESEWLDRYYNFMESTGRLGKVGTIQIPHHGSRLSHSELCIENITLHHNIPLICVISVGEKNRYGHPSSDLISQLLHRRALVWCVTERFNSTLFELISFY